MAMPITCLAPSGDSGGLITCLDTSRFPDRRHPLSTQLPARPSLFRFGYECIIIQREMLRGHHNASAGAQARPDRTFTQTLRC
jgi:hypothetical protein